MTKIVEVEAAIVMGFAQVVATADGRRTSLVNDVGDRTTARTSQRHVERSRLEEELLFLFLKVLGAFILSAVHAVGSVRPGDETVGSGGTVRAGAVWHGVVVARAAVCVRVGLETVRAW